MRRYFTKPKVCFVSAARAVRLSHTFRGAHLGLKLIPPDRSEQRSPPPPPAPAPAPAPPGPRAPRPGPSPAAPPFHLN